MHVWIADDLLVLCPVGSEGDTAEDSDAIAAVLAVVEGENDAGKPHHKGTKHEGDDDR